MAKRQAIGAAFLASAVLCGAALAQGAMSIANRDVVGDWTLRITPAERQDLKITFQSRDGGPFTLPLTITTQANGRLACVVGGDPAECRIRDGRLVVVSSSGSGVRMTFTLADRTREGFSGAASLRIRLLPIGGSVGAVTMARR